MCGIVGGISKSGWFNISEILNSISHRGPDNSGFFLFNSILLGHTRLAIQDLSDKGNQPMSSEDGRYTIVFNGEIYNHNEIRKKYLVNLEFKSTCDTETVLYAYISLGSNCLNLFNGIFAFVIYDNKENELFIARDHFGVKPLYYSYDGSNFFFSSEIKALLKTNISKEIDFNSLVNYMTFLWSPGERTPFLHVKKLLPGHYIKLNIGEKIELQLVNYFTTFFNGQYTSKSEKNLTDELEQLLLDSLSRQLLSDVPVGFFLSGGLDSTLLVALAKKINSEKKITCFTIDSGNSLGESEGFANDIDYAIKAAKFLNVDLNIVKIQNDILIDFDKMIWFLDEPQADLAPLHVLNIAKLAKSKGIKVLIGGAAGDDIFSGYRRHQALFNENFFNILPKKLRRVIKKIANILPDEPVLFRRLKKLTQYLDLNRVERMKGYFRWTDNETIISLFRKEHFDKIKGYDPSKYFDYLLSEIPQENSSLNQMLHLELKTFLVDHNLNYTDKMSMAEGVEVRVPYLDLELVEFSQKLPPHLKMKGITTKYLLKKVAERYLPKEIIYRPKTGFGAPVRKWIKEDYQNIVSKGLSKHSLLEFNIFDDKEIENLIKKNSNGEVDASYTILSLLSINSWLKQFLSKDDFQKIKNVTDNSVI
jgi:asparagine synthase (glutamine-hydrolysing)